MASINAYGQNGFKPDKNNIIADFMRKFKIGIVCFKETNINDQTYENNYFILDNFDLVINNPISGYGTSILISNSIKYENVRYNTDARAISIDLPDLVATICNIYLLCGSNFNRKNKQNDYCTRVIPNPMINALSSSILIGDFNSIIANIDCTNNANIKLNPSQANLVKVFEMKDNFRS